jgi:hypothetical protein
VCRELVHVQDITPPQLFAAEDILDFEVTRASATSSLISDVVLVVTSDKNESNGSNDFWVSAV